MGGVKPAYDLCGSCNGYNAPRSPDAAESVGGRYRAGFYMDCGNARDRFRNHYRDVREFEKDFLPEKLDELLLGAEKVYCGKHFFLKDRVISLGALAEFDYSDVYWTGVFRQKTYRTAVKPLLLEVRFKNGKHVIMEFPYFSQKSLKAKAFIDERAGIAQENSKN